MQKYAKKQAYFFTIAFLIVFVMNSNVSVPKQQLNTLHPDFNTLFLCLFVLYNFEIITKCSRKVQTLLFFTDKTSPIFNASCISLLKFEPCREPSF